MKIFRLLPLLLLYACATVVHPTGGPKDETPPQILISRPDSNQVNFQENELVIRFDEYVEIKDPNAFVISPPTKEKPKLSIKGKSLHIKFKEDLSPNTTYILQLNKLVQDITEKNILSNQEIRFSTGNIIDTLTITGYVYDHVTHEPIEDASVGLFYKNINEYPDSAIFPLFISRTNTAGSFKLDGLPHDTFTLYAFRDINFNNKYETGESFAFLNKPISSNDSITATLYLAKNENLKDLQINSPLERDYHSFFLPVIQNAPGTIKILSELPSHDKTQKVYSHFITKDTLIVYDTYKELSDSILNYYIFLDDKAIDTINIKFNNEHLKEYRLPSIKRNTLEPFDTLYLEYYAPLLKTDPSKIHLFKDSIEVNQITIANSFYQSYILFQPESKSNYKLIIEKEAYTTFDHTKETTDTFLFTTPDYSKYGDIQIKWKGDGKSTYKVELLKDKAKSADFVLYSNSDSIQFNGIPSGTYFARISLANQGSTTHLIPFKKQAISYYYYTKNLELRGSWTIKDVFIHIKEK